MATKIPVGRFLVEGVVVVVSILLAFGIDAWWAERIERAEAQSALNTLYEELEGNAARLERTLAFQAEVGDATESLLAAAGGDTDLPEDSVTALLGVLGFWRTTGFETGALEALLSSSGLSVIDDVQLRRGIANWSRNLADFVELEQQDPLFHREVWLPFLRENAELAAINNAVDNYPGQEPDGRFEESVPSPTGSDHRALLGDRTFRNVVLERLWVQSEVLGRATSLLRQAEALVDQLDSTSR
jgi:hypothetical protein